MQPEVKSAIVKHFRQRQWMQRLAGFNVLLNDAMLMCFRKRSEQTAERDRSRSYTSVEREAA